MMKTISDQFYIEGGYVNFAEYLENEIVQEEAVQKQYGVKYYCDICVSC